MKNLAIVDYGMSNLRSVGKAFEHVAENTWHIHITRDPHRINTADKIVFPGQGAIGNCMRLLRETGLETTLQNTLTQKKPFLGLCLGVQALLDFSEENGGVSGLGYVRGNVKRFADPLLDPNDPTKTPLKVPHMGWNKVQQTLQHPLWTGITDNSYFYFVHSYYVQPQETNVIAGQAEYGHPFTVAIAQDNIFAVQFHPEKSQHAGLRLLHNFLQW